MQWQQLCTLLFPSISERYTLHPRNGSATGCAKLAVGGAAAVAAELGPVLGHLVGRGDRPRFGHVILLVRRGGLGLGVIDAAVAVLDVVGGPVAADEVKD